MGIQNSVVYLKESAKNAAIYPIFDALKIGVCWQSSDCHLPELHEKSGLAIVDGKKLELWEYLDEVQEDFDQCVDWEEMGLKQEIWRKLIESDQFYKIFPKVRHRITSQADSIKFCDLLLSIYIDPRQMESERLEAPFSEYCQRVHTRLATYLQTIPETEVENSPNYGFLWFSVAAFLCVNSLLLT